MRQVVSPLWEYDAGTKAISVAMIASAEYVVVGSGDGNVHFVGRDGTVQWRYKVVEGEVFRLALSADAEYIAIGTLKGNYITLIDREGCLVWQQHVEAQTWAGAAITEDGSLVCGAADDGIVRMWDGSGHLLWQFRAGHDMVRRLSMAADGSYVAFGADDGCIYLLDRAGELRWKHATGASVWVGACITPDGEYVLAGSDDREVYLLHRDGRLLWHREVGDVTSIAIAPDGQHVAAGTTDGVVCLMDASGNLIWKHEAGAAVYGLALSADGRFVLVGSNDCCGYLLDAEGNLLHTLHSEAGIYGADISPRGRFCALACRDGHIHMLENGFAPEESASPDSPARPRRVVERVRRSYAENPFSGLCSWFEEFDHHLSRGDIDVCEYLLAEVRDQGYPLLAAEHRYVDSREGALWLRRGVLHHLAGRFDEAGNCYQRSLEIQNGVGCRACAEQVRFVLGILGADKASGAPDHWLDAMGHELVMLGDGEMLLRSRLVTADPIERRTIMLAALGAGQTGPPADGLRASDVETRMVAAAALARFTEVDAAASLLAGLQDDHWFVRWRCAEAIGQLAEPEPRVAAALIEALACEIDPEARRAMAAALGSTASREAGPALIQALGDADADVRAAAAASLAEVGTRLALPGLRKASAGQGILARDVRDATRKAIAAIEARHPLLPVTRGLATYRRVAGQQALQPADRFSPVDRVICFAAVWHARSDARYRVECTDAVGDVVAAQTGSHRKLAARADRLLAPQRGGARDTQSDVVEWLDATQITVGARVRCTRSGASASEGLCVGDTGTVRSTGLGNPPIGVEWDRDVGGHDGSRHFACADGRGWYVEADEVEVIGPSPRAGTDGVDWISVVLRPPGGRWAEGTYAVSLSVYDGELGIYEESAAAAFGVTSDGQAPVAP
jgi:outer membrane protein assembly factor BamB